MDALKLVVTDSLITNPDGPYVVEARCYPPTPEGERRLTARAMRLSAAGLSCIEYGICGVDVVPNDPDAVRKFHW